MIDPSVREISTARPRLRRDIRTHYQEYHGKPSYVVEDTANGKFFHIGFPEHQFIQSLDGHTTISVALARNAATQSGDALTEQQADQVIRWLIDNNLLENETSTQAERRRDVFTKRKEKQPVNWIQKLIFLKIPLGCPDQFLGKITPALKWIFSVHGFILWLLLLSYAVLKLAPHWDRFIQSSGQVVAPGNWWRILLVYAVLKVLHEIGHGIAVKKYRGEVPSCGVQMLLFITPLAYVDASASWRFSGRWARIVVASAGMYVELAIAAACVIAWVNTSPGTLNTTLHSAIIAASLITVLFNANPLMRFDGYYILADALGIPNLGTKGIQFMKWLGKKVFLGMKDQTLPPAVLDHPVAIPLYGILAAIWKVVIWFGIMVILSLFFKGAGLFLVILSVLVLLVKWVISFTKFLLSPTGPGIVRSTVRCGIFATVLVGIFYFIQIDPLGKAVGVVTFTGAEKVRADCEGQIVSVAVREGQQVEKGALLLQMTNPNEETERDQLRLYLKESKIRARRYYQDENLPAYQAELGTIIGLERSLEEKERYLDSLQVKAPIAGRVVGRNFSSLPGRWLRLGEEVMTLLPGGEREMLVSFHQSDIGVVRARESNQIICRLRGRRGEISGELERVEARATRAVPHPVLVGSNGGPLPLQASREEESERQTGIARGDSSDLDSFSDLGEWIGESNVELARPRFSGRAKLNIEEGMDLMEGEWGYLKLTDVRRQRLGSWLYEEASDFLRKQIERAESASSNT